MKSVVKGALLASILASFVSVSAMAQSQTVVEKGRNYQLTYIQVKEAKAPIKLHFEKSFTTNDQCNHYSLDEALRIVELPTGVKSIVQDFVADLKVMHTLVFCAPGAEKTVTVVSKTYEIAPQYGVIMAQVLVPDGYKLVLE